MSGAENKLLVQMINKLGLSEHEQLLPKSTELLRLLQLKSTGSNPSIVSDYAKATICTDLACSLLGLPFDSDIALKMTGMKKTAYTSSRRFVEKILDISKTKGINEICVQLGLNQVQKEAFAMLENYKRYMEGCPAEVDFSHPQYATMAVFQACKKLKVKAPKPKLLSCSHLKQTQWIVLEKNWEKFLFNTQTESVASKSKASEETHNRSVEATAEPRTVGLKHSSPEKIEPYVNWKKRMLEKAYRELKALQSR